MPSEPLSLPQTLNALSLTYSLYKIITDFQWPISIFYFSYPFFLFAVKIAIHTL
jgi:hypothetical protein